MPRQIISVLKPRIIGSGSMHFYEAEEEEAENSRIRKRVDDALADESGRMRLWLNSHLATVIPDDVGRIYSLRELYCMNASKVTRLPETLSKLEALQILDVSHCNIRSLPDGLSALPSLKELDASHNQLETFFWDPDCIGRSLILLNLACNKIRYFSFILRDVFAEIRTRSQKLFASQLHQRESIHIEDNPLLRVADADFEKWKLLFVPSLSPLSDLLPPHVTHCCVCGKEVSVGQPFVFVKYDIWTAIDEPSIGGERRLAEAADPPLRVPFFFPYCSAECCIALQAVHNPRAR